MDELRMHAYYYGFDRTGVLAVDKILSAVACAGKAYHHTEEWTGPGFGCTEGEKTEAEKIQDAAIAAANSFRTAPPAPAAVKAARRMQDWEDGAIHNHDAELLAREILSLAALAGEETA